MDDLHKRYAAEGGTTGEAGAPSGYEAFPLGTGGELKWVALTCLVCAAAADLLFFRQPLGWTVGLYALGLLLVVVVRDRSGFVWTKAGIVLTGFTVALCFGMLVHPGVLNTALAALAVVSLGLASRCGWTSDLFDWLHRWFSMLLHGGGLIFREACSASRRRRRDGERGTPAGLVLLKWTPVLLLAILFSTLFAIANPVIAQWIQRLWETVWSTLQTLSVPHPLRILLWVGVVIAVWALLRHCPSERIARRLQRRIVALPMEDFFLSPEILVGALSVFNLLFAIQNLLDVGYLWGGAALPNAMTYAEYAQRGAYPLVVTALLAAGFILVAFRATADTRRGRLARGLVVVWVAQNVFLTLSAGWRLNLYVEVYSLTRLRVAAAIWMVLVAAGLVLICVRIVTRRSNAWLVNANILSLLTVLFVCSFIDFDGRIARYNCRHCKEVTGTGASLDLSYIRKLGPDALPAVAWLRAQGGLEEPFIEQVELVWEAHERQLERDLGNWRGWTWRRRQLATYSSTMTN